VTSSHIVTSNSLNNLVDGSLHQTSVDGCLQVTRGTAPHSFSIKMTAPAVVNYLLISDSTESTYVLEGQVTVGFDSDVTKNPSCGFALNGGGLYECSGTTGLNGIYIGIV